MKIGIIGKGAFGFSLKRAFSFSHEVEMYGREAKDLNPKAVSNLLFLTIPSDAVINNQNAVKFYINHFYQSSIILTSKGFETFSLYNTLSSKEKERVFIFSGPNLSDQLGETPSAVILANNDIKKTEDFAKFLTNDLLKVVPSHSPLLVQFGGVLKNLLVFYLGQHWHELDSPEKKVIAIMESIMAGASIIRKNKNINKNFEEFYGISGVGDLLLCTDLFPIKTDGLLSRNFLAGQAIARGATEEEMYEGFKTVESYNVVKMMQKEVIPELDTPELKKFLRDLKTLELKELELDLKSDIYKEMRSEWKSFKKEAKNNHYFSNTFAWKFCEIIENSARKYSLELTIIENSRFLLSHLLYIVLSTRKKGNFRILNNLKRKFKFLQKS